MSVEIIGLVVLVLSSIAGSIAWLHNKIQSMSRYVDYKIQEERGNSDRVYATRVATAELEGRLSSIENRLTKMESILSSIDNHIRGAE